MNSDSRLVGGLVIAVHALLVGVAVTLAGPQATKVLMQWASGYVPDYYWFIVLLVVVPLGISATTLLALVAWWRAPTRFVLALNDAVVTLLVWSLLVVYLMSAPYLEIALLILAPLSLGSAIVATRRSRHRAASG